MSAVMSQKFDLQQKKYGCGQKKYGCGQNGCGQNGGLCPTCEKSFTASTTTNCPDGNPRCSDETQCDLCRATAESLVKTRERAGGGKVCDVKPLQHLRRYQLCQDCQKGDPHQGCPVCATMRKTFKLQPFTNEDVEELHKNFKGQFKPSWTGRTFALVISLDDLTVGSINWTMHNCAFSTLVLMLSSSNAGMNSINQKTFAGYVLAVIINSLQETGKCDPIVLEVFRFELTVLSGNPAWSNWSELTDFGNLYNECVKLKIILGDNVEIVHQKTHVAPFLNGKTVSLCVEAHRWVPSISHMAHGIFSSNGGSRFRISAIILHNDKHFSVIIVKDGFWLIDGKGKRTCEFTADSTITRLTCVEAQKLCEERGAFYFLEEVPFIYEDVVLSGKKDLPPIKVIYGEKFVFIHDYGKIIFQEPNKTCFLMNSFIGIDEFGKHIRVFPYIPPPPASPAHCAEVASALPTQQAHRAKVAPALPPPQAQYPIVGENPKSQPKVVANDMWIHDGDWYVRSNVTFHQNGKFLGDNKYQLVETIYTHEDLLVKLNELFVHHLFIRNL